MIGPSCRSPLAAVVSLHYPSPAEGVGDIFVLRDVRVVHGLLPALKGELDLERKRHKRPISPALVCDHRKLENV